MAKPKHTDNQADVNKDGKVDEKDLSIVHKAYHKAQKEEGKKDNKSSNKNIKSPKRGRPKKSEKTVKAVSTQKKESALIKRAKKLGIAKPEKFKEEKLKELINDLEKDERASKPNITVIKASTTDKRRPPTEELTELALRVANMLENPNTVVTTFGDLKGSVVGLVPPRIRIRVDKVADVPNNIHNSIYKVILTSEEGEATVPLKDGGKKLVKQSVPADQG